MEAAIAKKIEKLTPLTEEVKPIIIREEKGEFAIFGYNEARHNCDDNCERKKSCDDLFAKLSDAVLNNKERPYYTTEFCSTNLDIPTLITKNPIVIRKLTKTELEELKIRSERDVSAMANMLLREFMERRKFTNEEWVNVVIAGYQHPQCLKEQKRIADEQKRGKECEKCNDLVEANKTLKFKFDIMKDAMKQNRERIDKLEDSLMMRDNMIVNLARELDNLKEKINRRDFMISRMSDSVDELRKTVQDLQMKSDEISVRTDLASSMCEASFEVISTARTQFSGASIEVESEDESIVVLSQENDIK